MLQKLQKFKILSKTMCSRKKNYRQNKTFNSKKNYLLTLIQYLKQYTSF